MCAEQVDEPFGRTQAHSAEAPDAAGEDRLAGEVARLAMDVEQDHDLPGVSLGGQRR